MHQISYFEDLSGQGALRCTRQFPTGGDDGRRRRKPTSVDLKFHTQDLVRFQSRRYSPDGRRDPIHRRVIRAMVSARRAASAKQLMPRGDVSHPVFLSVRQ